jgi:hypothetical protein
MPLRTCQPSLVYFNISIIMILDFVYCMLNQILANPLDSLNILPYIKF